MADYQMLAAAAADHASANYSRKNHRFDVIVECMSLSEIASTLQEANVTTKAGAIKWATDFASLQHEQELNQAEDGPESCVGSSLFAGERCPACGVCGCDEQCPEMDKLMRPVVTTHICSHTGHPHYSSTLEEAAPEPNPSPRRPGCSCSEDQLALVGCDCDIPAPTYDAIPDGTPSDD